MVPRSIISRFLRFWLQMEMLPSRKMRHEEKKLDPGWARLIEVLNLLAHRGVGGESRGGVLACAPTGRA